MSISGISNDILLVFLLKFKNSIYNSLFKSGINGSISAKSLNTLPFSKDKNFTISRLFSIYSIKPSLLVPNKYAIELIILSKKIKCT